MKTLCTTNIRGGAGKTTDATHLAIAGAIKKRRVLAVDLDPQHHLSLSLLADLPADPNLFISAALTGNLAQPMKTNVPGLDLIPSHLEFSSTIEGILSHRKIHWEETLTRTLERFSGDYDYCVIDTPATYSRIHALAFHASDGYLISLRPEAFSLLGFSESMEQVELFKEECRIQNPKFLGYILNGVPKAHRKAVQRIKDEMHGDFENMGFDIPQDSIFDEIRWEGRATKSVFDFPGTTEYQDVFLKAWKTIEKRLEANA